MAKEITFEEREAFIEQQILEKKAKEEREKNINLFLNEEGISDIIKEQRKKVYDEYVSKKIEDNPSIAQDINIIKDYFIIGTDLINEKKTETNTEQTQTDGTNQTQGQETKVNTPANTQSSTPTKTVGKTGIQDGLTAKEVIEKFDVSDAQKKDIENYMRMAGLIPDDTV